MIFSTARLGLGATAARFAPRLVAPLRAAAPFNLIQRQLFPVVAVTTITDLRAFHTTAAMNEKSRSAEDRYRSKCALARQGRAIIYVDGSWRMKDGEISATFGVHFATDPDRDRCVRICLSDASPDHPIWVFQNHYAELMAIHVALDMVEMWEDGAIIHTDSMWAYDLIKGQANLRGEWKVMLDKIGAMSLERLDGRNVKLVKVESKTDLGNRKAHQLATRAHKDWCFLWSLDNLKFK
ncbi:hypothetical protein GGF31_004765 [Allomyces arbusculus]|nr:hypothetical protein GGF31_004765 [Allomyces arbusculus]